MAQQVSNLSDQELDPEFIRIVSEQKRSQKLVNDAVEKYNNGKSAQQVSNLTDQELDPEFIRIVSEQQRSQKLVDDAVEKYNNGKSVERKKIQPIARNWCFTLNNYTKEQYEALIDNEIFNYLIIGKEKGVNGTPHLQGYCQLKDRKRLNQLKKINNSAHWEMAKGTPEENKKYCSKDGDFIEKGIMNVQGKKKVDLVKAVAQTVESKSIKKKLELRKKRKRKYPDCPGPKCNCRWCFDDTYDIYDSDDGIHEHGNRQEKEAELIERGILKAKKKTGRKAQEARTGKDGAYIINDRPHDERSGQFEVPSFSDEEMPTEEETLKPWQRDIIHQLQQQEQNKDGYIVNWIVDKQGGNGTTYLSKYLSKNKNATILNEETKKKFPHTQRHGQLVVYKLTKPNQPKQLYETMRNLRDGRYIRLGCELCCCPRSQVLVLSNHMPRLKEYSIPRWNLHEIKDNKLEKIDVKDIYIC